MKLLLDTHAVLWFVGDASKVPSRATEAIEDPANEILLSAVVPWEIAIKRASGKIELAGDQYLNVMIGAGATELPVTIAHARAVEDLPRHHSDPFDRLLISQAILEGATIVTGDARMAKYDVPILW